MKACIPALLLFAAAASHAQAIYMCVQPNGIREYRNVGDTRGCKKLELHDISLIPSPLPRQAKAAQAEAFPKVDGATQKRRDQDRMQILLEEMRAEEERLSGLRREYRNGEPERRGDERNYAKYQERVASMKDEVERTEKNIEALKREIGNLK